MSHHPLVVAAAAVLLSEIAEDMRANCPYPCSPGSSPALLYQAAAQSILQMVDRSVDEKAGIAHQIVRAFSVAPLQLVAHDGSAIAKIEPGPAAILHGVAVDLAQAWVNEVRA